VELQLCSKNIRGLHFKFSQSLNLAYWFLNLHWFHRILHESRSWILKLEDQVIIFHNSFFFYIEFNPELLPTPGVDINIRVVLNWFVYFLLFGILALFGNLLFVLPELLQLALE